MSTGSMSIVFAGIPKPRRGTQISGQEGYRRISKSEKRYIVLRLRD